MRWLIGQKQECAFAGQKEQRSEAYMDFCKEKENVYFSFMGKVLFFVICLLLVTLISFLSQTFNEHVLPAGGGI